MVHTTDRMSDACDEDTGARTRCAVFKPEQSRKHTLECLRLESDCLQLACDAPSPSTRSHFVRMAHIWLAHGLDGTSVDLFKEPAASKNKAA